MATAPRSNRIRDEAMPIDRDAGIGDEERAGNDLARVGGDERDVGIRCAAVCPARAKPRPTG